MKLLWWRRPKILTIGSVLIDTVAIRTLPSGGSEEWESIAPGEITTSIGGCSYNIAIGLGLLKVPGGVGLFTYLPNETTTTQLIWDRLTRLGVSTRYVFQLENLAPDGFTDKTDNKFQVKTGGFVGTRDPLNADLHIYAVQEMLSDNDFLVLEGRKTELIDAMRSSEAIVIDCALHKDTISGILRLAQEIRIPAFVHIVSSIKANNYLEAINNLRKDDDTGINSFCIMGKPKEIAKLLLLAGATKTNIDLFILACAKNEQTLPAALSQSKMCTLLRTRQILVTSSKPLDNKGRWTLFLDNRHRAYEFQVPEGIVANILGLSEAVSAAFVYTYAKTGQLRRNRITPINLDDEKINRALKDNAQVATGFSLMSRGATPSSVFGERDPAGIRLPGHVRLRELFSRFETITKVGLAIIGGIVLIVEGVKNYELVKQFFLTIWTLIAGK